MTPITNLFIRACKTRDPKCRLNSIMRRFYLEADEQDMTANVSQKLLAICDTYQLLSLAELSFNLSPANRWKYFNDVTIYDVSSPAVDNDDRESILHGYNQHLLGIVISAIRHSRTNCFEADGFIRALKHRNGSFSHEE